MRHLVAAPLRGTVESAQKRDLEGVKPGRLHRMDGSPIIQPGFTVLTTRMMMRSDPKGSREGSQGQARSAPPLDETV
jgi:hypothetical protein